MLDDGGGADGVEGGFCFGKNDVGSSNGFAEFAFDVGILIVFGNGEDVGFCAKKIAFKVKAEIGVIPNADFIDNFHRFQQGLFVFVGEAAGALLVVEEAGGCGKVDG